jgi:hypothetical protein
MNRVPVNVTSSDWRFIRLRARIEEHVVARGQHVFAQHPVDTPTDQMHSHSFGASQNGSEWKTWVGGRLGPLG